MKTAKAIGQHVVLTLLLLVTFGCGTALGQDPNTPAEGVTQGGQTGTATPTTVSGALDAVYEYLAKYGLQMLAAIIILVVGRWIAKLLAKLVSKGLTKAKVDATLIPFVENLAYTAMLVLVVIAALAKLGVQTTSAIAILGAAGLAVGLALQGSLANFASGVLILVFKPFKAGDFVEVAGTKGTVQAIHIFNTVLNSPDNVRIIVPNSAVTGGNISNYTINGTRRVDLAIGVSYGDDLKKARQVIEKVLASDERVLDDPAPVIGVSALADSSVNFVVRPWVKSSDYWPAYFDLTEQIKVALDKGGITIPFPQHDIHIKDGAAKS